MTERKHPEAECESCPLLENGRFCNGEGPEQADLVVVGEAPGRNEAREGRPFTGISGKVLDSVLQHYGIDREEAFVTNAVLCRPSNNDTPDSKAVRCCSKRLKSDIDNRGASTVLALGNIAAQSVMGIDDKITQLRVGPPKESHLYPGVTIIPSIHPAACLYSPDMFPHLVTDVGKLTQEQHKEFQAPEYHAFDDTNKAWKVLDELLKSSYEWVSFDLEVGVDKDADYSHPDSLLCAGLAYEDNKVIVIGEEPLTDTGVQQKLVDVLKAKKVLCHNGKFDLGVLYNLGLLQADDLPGLLSYDTMLASYVTDERPGTNGLKYLAKELLGAPDWDFEIKKYLGSKQDSFAMVPRSVLYKYNAYDAALTLQLKSLLETRVQEEEVGAVLNLLLDASMALLLVESEGVRIDYEHLDKLTDEFLAELDDLESKLKPWVANPRSPQQVKAALEEHFYRIVQTTDENQLRDLLKNAQGDFKQFLDLLLEHRKSQKLYGTYVKGTRKRMQAGKVFPTFLLHGTTTGRLACRNPNLQNVPRESSIRQLFSCEPGNKIVQADYKAAELRVMATEARDAFLKSVFREGRDLHSEVTKRFYGENFTKEQRVRGKAVVFGVSYGREAYSIAKEFEISVEEAQEFIDTFFELIPDVDYWREQVKHRVLKEGKPLQTHFGRKRRFWLITPENQQDVLKEAYAFVPQSTASDLTLNSLIRLHREVPVRITVHDSIIAEVPEEDAEEVGKHMCDVMQQTAADVYDDYVPFEAEYGIGDSWGDVE